MWLAWRRPARNLANHQPEGMKPGQVFIPMHHDAVNRLTFAGFDPHSRQPSHKHCAVKLSPP